MERFLPQKKRFCVVILIFCQEHLLGIGNREKALEKPVRGNQEWDDNSRVSLLGGPHLCAWHLLCAFFFSRKSRNTLCQYLSLGIHLLYSALQYCSKALPLNGTIMVTLSGED